MDVGCDALFALITHVPVGKLPPYQKSFAEITFWLRATATDWPNPSVSACATSDEMLNTANQPLL